MESNSPRRPVLYKGQLYSKEVNKSRPAPPKEPKVSFSEAKEKIVKDIEETAEKIKELSSSEKLPNELVLCIRMHPDFSAKSYYPDTLFDKGSEKFGFKEIGSRIWRSGPSEEGNQEGKMFFVRTSETKLEGFKNELNKNESQFTKKFKLEVRRLASVDLLSTTERVLGIPSNWNSGYLEAVLHPFSEDKDLAYDKFILLLKEAGVNTEKIKRKQYEGGITFISFSGDRKVLKAIEKYNPLRTVHPIEARELNKTGNEIIKVDAPSPPSSKIKPTNFVGVFDGGIDSENPYFKGFVDPFDCVSGPICAKSVRHGSQVVSAVLYGYLNNYTLGDELKNPLIGVKSFRVLSSDNSLDPDLYEVIDAIEEVVPKHPEIKVYNLSLGPKGPMLDDQISRFTFACDLLSVEHSVLFCIAVGNDGHHIGYDRIQSPADMVNGLAVGAYTSRDSRVMRAPYSCIGPGREGNKMKPDILAFGGCSINPIHLLSEQIGARVLSHGTSFATPLVSNVAAQLIGRSNQVIDSLLARTLLIHSAQKVDEELGYGYEMGHGILPDSIDNIISCVDKSYTLIYSGELTADKYFEFQIPWIEDIATGKAVFRWTASVLTDVDPVSPDDYTYTAIETYFYPNANVFTFTKSGEKPKVVNIQNDPQQARDLLSLGYTQSAFPKSESSPTSFEPEYSLRKEMKWDTLDSKIVRKFAKSISMPTFILHAIRRGSRKQNPKIKYAFVLSVTLENKSNIDFYSKIVAKYPSLVPVNINVENTVPVSISNQI